LAALAGTIAAEFARKPGAAGGRAGEHAMRNAADREKRPAEAAARGKKQWRKLLKCKAKNADKKKLK
jgi:hypothetical protein